MLELEGSIEVVEVQESYRQELPQFRLGVWQKRMRKRLTLGGSEIGGKY